MIFVWFFRSLVYLIIKESGDYCLTGGADKSIKLWKPSTALCLNSYKAHSGDILDLMASSDNSNIISASSDCKGYLWDVATCKVLRKFMPNNGPLNAIKFNKYDSLVFTGSTDSKVKIYDIKGSLKDPIMVLFLLFWLQVMIFNFFKKSVAYPEIKIENLPNP